MHEVFDSQIQKQVEAAGVVAVLTIDDAGDAVPLAEALLAGGVTAMELTLRTPAAVPALKAIREHVPEMLPGIGTVLTPSQLDEVADAGAAFAVSPGLNPEVIARAKELHFSFAPGIMTPSDIETAVAMGCRLLKFFPAESSGGMKHLKSMAGPYAHLGLRYIPLGGLNENNVREYFDSPLVAAIGGSWLARRDRIAAHDWAGISANAETAMHILHDVRDTPP